MAFDFFGRTMFEMNGFTQVAPRVATYPNVMGPPPYGIWPASFTEEAIEEARRKRARDLGQTTVNVQPARCPSVLGILLGGGLAAAALSEMAFDPKLSAKRAIIPGLLTAAGALILWKSL